MILLSAEKVSKSFSEKALLQKASLYLSDADKVGIIHDRYFLERVTNRIVGINGGALYTYDGSYSQFLLQSRLL